MTSDFYDQTGYFADALGLATVVLPPGWEERLQPLTDADGNVLARCLELHDAAVSKLMAGREKDFDFISTLLQRQLIALETLTERAASIQQTASAQALLPRLTQLRKFLQERHHRHDFKPLHALIARLSSSA